MVSRWDDLEGDRDGQKRVCPPDGHIIITLYNIITLQQYDCCIYYIIIIIYIAARK